MFSNSKVKPNTHIFLKLLWENIRLVLLTQTWVDQSLIIAYLRYPPVNLEKCVANLEMGS